MSPIPVTLFRPNRITPRQSGTAGVQRSAVLLPAHGRPTAQAEARRYPRRPPGLWLRPKPWKEIAALFLCGGALAATLAANVPVSSSPAAGEAPPAHPLVWDALEKTCEPKPGDGAAAFEFFVTNTSGRPVEVLQIRTSCGCTVAEMPSIPWVLAPGASGSFHATVDFRGKQGKLSKALFVNSTAGTQTLGVTVNIPEDPMRLQNQHVALGDRQAVFRGTCASCHVQPIGAAQGATLFQAECVICHGSERRASMVPDLFTAREPRDAAYWRKWITEGREQSMMPAFAQSRGGPLTATQVESLVEFALGNLPTRPRPN